MLRCDVQGRLVMKAFLSGMPDIKLGLNDKLEVRASAGVLRACLPPRPSVPCQHAASQSSLSIAMYWPLLPGPAPATPVPSRASA